jgi:hypothetical protein
VGIRYRNRTVDNLMYVVFLPSMVIHTGLQEVTIVGYSRGGKGLCSCGRLYILGDS